ncbi:phage tail tape measure protein [Martelella lutilitoris]|uniref:Phage tail tape measure protein n=1 Tax=Martelella lutilitoris TaxID=2583532 RepID=A0A7T7HHD3_9HYPH|nr:phage tail tape measure protein [Martelella lutilitoris]QQM29221.1 phage tail tape measure protein [Martelella lutilitoris]
MEPGDDYAEAVHGASALYDVLVDLEAQSDRFSTAITGALKDATLSGKGLQSVLGDLGRRLSELALSSALKPLENAISGQIGNLADGLIQVVAHANGGVPGRITPFADGGVVSRPTYFPMSGGLGLMGEAGSEAILPLKRGPDGALGVSASGGGGGPQIVFNVTAQDAASFQKSQGQISAMLARAVRTGQRNL